MNRANRLMFLANCLVLGLIAFVAAAPFNEPPDFLKVKRIEAESITVKSPGSADSVSLLSGTGATGIWVNRGEREYASLQTTPGQSPSLLLNASNGNDGADFAITPDRSDGSATIQFRGDRSKKRLLRHLDASSVLDAK
jgi:hypothetical protein